MLAISKSATELGLENATVKLTVEKLAEMPMPCILHWDQRHYVVLYKISDRGGASTSPTLAKVKCASAPMNSENIG